MSAWKKYLILFAALFLIGAALTWLLDKTKLPPALQPARVQQVFQEELEYMRNLVRDMPAEYPPLPDLSQLEASDTEALEAEYASLKAEWDEIEERGEQLEHPAIRAAAVQIRQGVSNRIRMVLYGNHRFHHGWKMVKKQPALGQPIVTKIFGSKRPRILYQEVVEAKDGKERSFDLIIEANFLYQASEQIEPAPADASPPSPK